RRAPPRTQFHPGSLAGGRQRYRRRHPYRGSGVCDAPCAHRPAGWGGRAAGAGRGELPGQRAPRARGRAATRRPGGVRRPPPVRGRGAVGQPGGVADGAFAGGGRGDAAGTGFGVAVALVVAGGGVAGGGVERVVVVVIFFAASAAPTF